MLQRKVFNVSELTPVNESNFVILASGGPLMEIESLENDKALCKWTDNEKIARAVFPIKCLRKLVPIIVLLIFVGCAAEPKKIPPKNASWPDISWTTKEVEMADKPEIWIMFDKALNDNVVTEYECRMIRSVCQTELAQRSVKEAKNKKTRP